MGHWVWYEGEVGHRDTINRQARVDKPQLDSDLTHPIGFTVASPVEQARARLLRRGIVIVKR